MSPLPTPAHPPRHQQQQQPGPPALAGGRASQWWRQRDSPLPRRSIFNYGRIRIPGNALQGRQHVQISPLLSGQAGAVASLTPGSRRPLASSLPFTRGLMLPLSRRIFFFLFFFCSWTSPPPCGAQSRRRCSPSDSSRSDLWARTGSRRRATHRPTDALSKSGSPLQTVLYHNRATAMTWIMNSLLMYACAGW